MILIKKIEYIETDRDPIEIVSMNRPDAFVPVLTDTGKEHIEVKEIIELVRGRRFCRPSDGLDIIIGMPKKVQDLIVIQYEAWDRMATENTNTHLALSAALRKTREDGKASFFTRLKWLFCGYR